MDLRRPKTELERDLSPAAALPGRDPSAPADDLLDGPVSSEEDRAEKLKRRLLRLAFDVHDGPMQNLTAVGHRLVDLRSRLRGALPPTQQERVDAEVDAITAELIEVEQELRSLMNALEDGASKTIPLLDAIESEIREFKRHSLADVELIFDGSAQARTDSQRIALQSIARSALANVARHADAYNVRIRLYGLPDAVGLEIEDDGRGFDSTKPPRPGRLGLVGMKERVALLGGSFAVQSRPGGPTVVSAVLQNWSPPAP
jgi:signal transduction histidine kinase